MKKCFISIFIFLLIAASCEKSDFVNETKLLTKYSWYLDSCTNIISNEQVTINHFVYHFNENGEAVLTFENGNTQNLMWQLLSDNKYLKIGNDIYHLKSISNNLLILQFGELEFNFRVL